MSSKQLRICLIIPSLGPGGMERVMSLLAVYLSNKQDVEIHLILYGRTREIFYSMPDSITVHRPTFEFDNTKRKWCTIKTLFFLRRKIQSLIPDTILSFGEDWNNLVLLSLLGLKKSIYVADRAEPGLKRNPIQEHISKLLYPKANGIIVQTEIAKKIYSQIYKSVKIIAIGNPIRKIHAGPVSERENIILSVGRLVSTKHFDLLIDIYKSLNISEWKLVIVGGDSQRQNEMQKLKRLISKSGLDGKVLLTGMVSNVEDYYRKSRIFAFTSSSEGFPNVIGEAMSCGLPVIAFDCVAGPSELIEDGVNGYLIPLFDNEKFRSKLKFLIENESLRKKMAEASQQKVKSYSIEDIGEKFYKTITAHL